MKIAVVGTGYVGLVTGTCLADAGHPVSCIDIDEAKVQRMQQGQIPIYEPGLEEMFSRVLGNGFLQITTDLGQGIEEAEAIFLALPTPPGADGSADLTAVLSVASQLGPLLKQYAVVIDKSTVPVGTAEQVRQRIAAGSTVEFDVVSNPEFLREGLAVQDFTHPDRIVIGTDSQRAEKVMEHVYQPFIEHFADSGQWIVMDVRSAELTKYAANSFLAMKVSFMNEIANLAERLGADVEAVRRGIGPDQRIGTRFLQAGIGFGGSCFPKDVLALHKTSQDVGYDFKLLGGILKVNALQKKRLLEKVVNYYQHGAGELAAASETSAASSGESSDAALGKSATSDGEGTPTGSLKGKHFGLWGLAFKPDTDDIREAPALEIIDGLLEQGATVTAYDPEAIANVQRLYGNRTGLQYAESAMAAAKDADALLITTEWREFRNIDFTELKAALKQPTVFDGRNLYEPAEMHSLGFYYEAIGRPTE